MTEQDIGPGISRKDIYNIRFYEKEPFNGSYRGMRYRIAGTCGEDAGARQLCVTTWPGPYNFDHTDDGLKVSVRFTFSNEGLDAAAEYLNEFYREHFA